MSLNKSKVLRTAEKYVLQGKIPAAIDEYRKVVDADPSDLTTINTLGDLYVRAGRIQDAISNFSRIADSYREGGFTLKAIAMLKKISKLDPTNIETAMKLANLYSQQGLLVEARQQYLQVADAYARAGQTRKALEAYQKIADLDPSNTSVRMKLAEIYSREKMNEQAHEAFLMAGAEFLRKGDVELALNANLKAIVINPDSRQALTAIATIYTEQGQIDRAINILCEAFERNPGDIELLTILGRTYLSAGMMDDAERTFLSLVELDKNRYHYLLEVGRRFLQIGDLDRAAEQIDGCMEVLIAKREEDKAIDFLRRVLDRDMNHIGALKRLSQIFNRIREDHNLIATLNSLVEAAMKKGNEEEAIAALKELTRIEPDENLHLQRLYNLGVRDIVDAGSPDVVRATGPLDYQSAAFDDTFVIRQISEAEILAGHGQVDHAVSMLREILNHTPENVQVHQKLKDIYLRAGLVEQAANECIELGRIHEQRGEIARASDFVAEARQLNPLLQLESPAEPAPSGAAADFGWGLSESAGAHQRSQPDGLKQPAAAGGGFELTGASGSLDWKRYETGVLEENDQGALGQSPDSSPNASVEPEQANGATVAADSFGFSFADIISDEDGTPAAHASDGGSEEMFDSASSLPSDTMTGALREELEGIDFYIAQGYFDIAKDTLDRLREDHGDHAEFVSRYRQVEAYLGAGVPGSPDVVEDDPESYVEEKRASEPHPQAVPDVVPDFDLHAYSDKTPESLTVQPEEQTPEHPKGELPSEMGFEITAIEPTENKRERESGPLRPFLVQKESGPLYPDLLVQLNTSELLDHTAFDGAPPLTGSLAVPLDPRLQTDDLVESIMSDIGATLDEAESLATSDREPLLGPPSEVEPEDLPGIPVGVARGGAPEEYDLAADLSSLPEHEEPLQLGEVIQKGEPDFSDRSPELGAVGTPSEILSDMETPGGLQWRESDEPIADGSSCAAGESASVATGSPKPQEVRPARDELQEIFDELKGTTGDLMPLVDFETHFSLGLAYKDMDLLDEAVEEFQMAFRIAGLQGNDGDYIHCCNMLGVCFQRKQMPRVAVMWFQRGLKVPNRPEDEYQALRYEMGLCYEELNETDKAIDAFTEVYGIDVNYREVSEKLDQLQGAKNAC
jgi:tetratricopeptide (TPR) repeat protein